MYCPIDGEEFREGITRCPEHGVELEEEPPEIEELLSFLDRFNDRIIMRITFVVLLAAAFVYAVSGATVAFLYLMIQFRDWEADSAAFSLQQIQSAAFPIGIAALGGMVGAVILRIYLRHPERRSEDARASDSERDPDRSFGPISPTVMRLLFALTVLFALLWAGTGIATSKEQVELTHAFGNVAGERPEPSDTYLTLAALNYAGYTGGVAALAIMGAGLIAGTHERPHRKKVDPVP
ncbi:MAG: hypothetical protein ABR505_08860 [Actinomycetota bacterium]